MPNNQNESPRDTASKVAYDLSRSYISQLGQREWSSDALSKIQEKIQRHIASIGAGGYELFRSVLLDIGQEISASYDESVVPWMQVGSQDSQMAGFADNEVAAMSITRNREQDALDDLRSLLDQLQNPPKKAS